MFWASHSLNHPAEVDVDGLALCCAHAVGELEILEQSTFQTSKMAGNLLVRLLDEIHQIVHLLATLDLAALDLDDVRGADLMSVRPLRATAARAARGRHAAMP